MSDYFDSDDPFEDLDPDELDAFEQQAIAATQGSQVIISHPPRHVPPQQHPQQRHISVHTRHSPSPNPYRVSEPPPQPGPPLAIGPSRTTSFRDTIPPVREEPPIEEDVHFNVDDKDLLMDDTEPLQQSYLPTPQPHHTPLPSQQRAPTTSSTSNDAA